MGRGRIKKNLFLQINQNLNGFNCIEEVDWSWETDVCKLYDKYGISRTGRKNTPVLNA